MSCKYICKNCGKEYNWINGKSKNFCSILCQKKWNFDHENEKDVCFCQNCGKEYKVDSKLGNWDENNNQIIIHKSSESNKVVNSKRFCCYNCGKIYRLNKIKETNLKKYGTEYVFQSEEIKNKIKETNLKKYGVINVFQNKEIQNKIKETNINKFGTNNPSQLEEIKNKKKETNLKKYGTEYVFQSEEIKNKIKQTNLKKYSVDHYFKSFNYKNNYKNFEWLKNKQQKEYETKKKNHTLYQDIKNKIIQKAKDTIEYNRSIDPDYDNKIQLKYYETKQINKSFNTSKPEKEIYQKLIEKFDKDNVEWQYRSELYHFVCDFYIKSLDLYIEYQGHWTHGKEPYNKDNKDHQKILEKWKNKSQEINFKGEKKNYYKNAIYVWTELDHRKRKTAKNNNLNWLEFFNMNQFNDWYNKI